MKTLQERLIWARGQKAERDGVEFTQQDLANKAGVSQGNIAHLESGRTKTARNLVRIAEALGVAPTWLAEGKGKPFAAHSGGDWMIEQRVESDAYATAAREVSNVSTVRSSAREATCSLVWVDSSDLALLTLFHGTDDDGREKILRTAHRVPKVMQGGAVSNQS